MLQVRAPVTGTQQRAIRTWHRCKCRRVVQPRAASQQEQVPDLMNDVMYQNQNLFRGLPLAAGGFGFVSLLANRILSGIAPVVDASSSQSRADVLGIVLSAVLLLTGLQWASLKAKPLAAVALDGTEVMFTEPDAKLPSAAAKEMAWAWESLRANSRCRSLVIIYQGRNIFHAGAIKGGVKAGKAVAGDVCKACMSSGKGNYLANLILYPGRLEFTEFLPESSQGVVVQPIGKEGVLIVGTDTQRGISRLDQAWVATLADKLEVSLEGYKAPKPGVGFASSKA